MVNLALPLRALLFSSDSNLSWLEFIFRSLVFIFILLLASRFEPVMLVLVSLSLLVVKFIFKAFKFEGFEMVWLAVVVVFVPLISAANPRLKPEVPKLLVAAAVWDIRAVVLEATFVVARAIFATKYFSSSFMLSIKSVNSSMSE